ncbi:MAG: pyridoxal-phosphate dependent enzyme [Anaerolineae bacterium]|nr:pyridoxal-phosphate dependent enzyme [Anaerolineae bacterium]
MSIQPRGNVHLRCTYCGYREPYIRPLVKCPECGETIIEVEYDWQALKESNWQEMIRSRPFGLWRYRELLPLHDHNNIVTMGEGGTPLLHARRLGMMLGLKNLYIKDERQGPTGSFKDRQASVAVSVLKELGIEEMVVASTGNVAIAYSAYCARAGIKLWAFVTSLVPGDKMREMALYGTEVIKVTGTYDETKAVAARFAKSRDIYVDRGIKSIAAVESMTTLAYEIAEQLADEYGLANRGCDTPWCTPDWYVQGVSGGMGPIGVSKGFKELMNMGMVSKMPALACVQSAGCAPMVHAFEAGQSVATPVTVPQTLIATLATGDPGRAYQLLWDCIQDHGGYFQAATDEEAFAATRVLARMEGLSVEPATAVTFAGLFKMVRKGVFKPDDIVVVNCSGHTFPVEKQVLGEEWERRVDASKAGGQISLPEEGLLSALDHIDTAVRKIVVIEDTPDAARLIARILQARGGYQVHTATDGRAGIVMVRELKPDLVITDLMMPEVDGFQVIETIKADEELAGIPVIVLTAKELTPRERDRLSGQIATLLQKGSAMDEELLQSIVDSLD